MPNWANNHVTITGPKKDRTALVTLMKSQEKDFDFNRIIPMPDSLRVTSGSVSSDALAVALYKDRNDDSQLRPMLEWPWVKNAGITTIAALADHLIERHKERALPQLNGERRTVDADLDLLSFGRLLLDNIAKYGASTWYEWAIDNWGTKWNAGDADCKHGTRTTTYYFDTAWSDPRPVFEALKERFPTLTIHVSVGGEVDGDYAYTL